ncbi:MAG TPA: DNA repair protein RecN [Desulfobulbaceae bacterium]|nr:DNA repair protein RecN [Desulfobulbaceae bacterium]
MLQELRIKNLALLKSMHLELPDRDSGLVVLTGETGAGKSIILQALHLLTGGRGSSSWIRSDCPSAEVEAFFVLADHQQETLTFLQDHGLDSGVECLVRRVLTAKGRSRVFINDRAVTTRLAAELAESLLSIAGQHDHQQLLQARKHLDFLDSYGELWPKRQSFTRLFREWQQLSGTLRDLQEKEQDKEQRRDFLGYQLKEINEISPVSGEDERLAKERDLLKASSTLAYLVGDSLQLLRAKVLEPLAIIRKNMENAAGLDSEVGEIAERIISSCFEIEDLETSLDRYRAGLPTDHARLEEIADRLAKLKGLQRKYGQGLDTVLAYAEHAEQELAGLADLEDDIADLELALEKTSTKALLAATELSQNRKTAAAKLEKAMQEELTSLQFPQANFKVSLRCPEGMGMEGVQPSGRDQVEFLFSANPGEPVKPLAKVVSGGELSRLMLAMKCILARRDHVDTVIFDEVDAGIGGQAAEAVAAKISELATHHQVLCITHLPQIAAYAQTHYLVEKGVENGRTITSIRLLKQEERVQELARMLGGESPSRQTLALARELAEKQAGQR